jgi:hypothetical protein
MSFQISAGKDSLVALGFSLGDITTLESLSRRFGGWFTTKSGDAELFTLLDDIEENVLQRQGLIDISRFNKYWGSRIELLGHEGVVVCEGQQAEKVLENLGQFSAVMVCLVAGLDAFSPSEVAKSTLRRVLSKLLRSSENGEDILASQYPQRFNSWRSAAEVRGMSRRAREIRRDLINDNLIVGGLMPPQDAHHMVHFLTWLLGEKSELFQTPSSDIAGLGFVISELGINILRVEGLKREVPWTPCRLEYDPDQVIPSLSQDSLKSLFLSRVPSTTINLKCPEESLTTFPIDAQTANRCRDAWLMGSKAANSVACKPLIPDGRWLQEDLQYVFYDEGNACGRVMPQISRLALAHAFVANQETCTALTEVLSQESAQTLEWLNDETNESTVVQANIWDEEMQDISKLNAFTVFQAFFMGYYYSIFSRLVDTSELRLQNVEGAWGFRSATFLRKMRATYQTHQTYHTSAIGLGSAVQEGIRIMRREDLLGVLSALFLGTSNTPGWARKNTYSRDAFCIGIIDKRALLARSLVHPCKTILEVGSFVLLDVDVSGIPRDIGGLVRPGVPDALERPDEVGSPWDSILGNETQLRDRDATFHIEADWEGDPDTVLLCVRYSGRRVRTINPTTADIAFLKSLVRPAECLQIPQETPLPRALSWGIPELLSNHFPPHPTNPWILSLDNRPRLRYFAAELYKTRSVLRIATDSVEVAIHEGLKVAESQPNGVLFVVSANDDSPGPFPDDWVPEDISSTVTEVAPRMWQGF